MKTIGITGGTGFVGRHLTSLLLGKGYNVIILTRNAGKHNAQKGLTYAHWDPESQKCDTGMLKEVDTIVHLAGAGIADKRWTASRKKEIVNSRVTGTRFLTEMIKNYMPHCATLVSASAIGYYGPDINKNAPFTEDAAPANDFLGQTCLHWEQEALALANVVRTIILRFGIILGKDGGAYPKLAKPVQYGIVPILGNGGQIVSWIHIDDLCNILYSAMVTDQMQGIYNAVAPSPATHEAIMKTIARNQKGIKIPVSVPAFILRLMLGEMSIELLKSCTVSAEKLLSTGLHFEYPDIDAAISAINGDKHSR